MKKFLFLLVIVAAGFTACEDKDDPDGSVIQKAFCTITFNANGGIGTMADQQIQENTSAALTANVFSRAGYTFAGWNTQADGSGTSYSGGASYTAGAGSNSVTLYAQWTEILFTTVTFNANGGIGTMADQVIPENTSADLTANAFARTDHTFAGWNTQADGSGTSYSGGASYTAGAGSNSVTLYAIWTAISGLSSSVTFDANGGAGAQTAPVTAISGQAMPQLTVQPPAYETNSAPDNPYENNYEKFYFNGYWDAKTGGIKYYNADLTSARNWDKAGNTTLYAQWLTPAQKFTLGSGTGGAAYNFIDDFVAYYVDTPPAIDGAGTDPAWAKAKWQNINYAWMYISGLPTGATTPTPAGGPIAKTADFSGRFKVVWTADRLYILTEIIDDQIKTPNMNAAYTNPENNDCLELFISESASTSTQARGTQSNSTSHFFAYHMNFNEVDAMDYVGGNNNSNDPNTRIEGGFIKRNHHLNFKINKNDATHTYIWETEMKVYDSTYPVITSPEDRTPVTLIDGKKMGFAAAYNDNDTTKRDHFIGSMYVEGSSDDARNQGYRNASVYAKLYLVK